tara:strand:- start:518 stop:1222 length:705 start_codon:yes stop_codon:yes gene_type:complete
MEESMKLFVTSEYSIFKSHIQNRNINEKSVKKMMESISKYGLIQPIIVSSDGYVIDGQHRLSSCMRLGKEITYVVNYKINSKAVMEANNTQKKWNNDDWTKHYAELGNVDYQVLRTFISDLKGRFSSGKVQYAYYADNGNPSKSLREGSYRTNVNLGNEVIANCIVMKNIFSDAFHTRFIRALKTVMVNNDNFDVNELLKKCTQKKFNFYYNEADVVKEIVEVYNYKRKENKID